MSEAAETQAPSGPTPPVPLRRNRGFRLLWVGQVLSDTGTEAAYIAYPLLILTLTHSPAIAGIVGTAQLTVEMVLGLPGGAISDRLDRRLTMITCDSLRAGVLAVLAALVLLHAVSWPFVLAVAVIDGGANVLFSPAATAALPAIVADQQLEQAWAATEGRIYAASLAGPALGGFLFGLGSAVPFAGDAVSYLVSAGAVSRIRGKFRAERSGEHAALWREAVDGLRLVWRNQLLRAVIIQAPLANFAFNGAIFTITLALRRAGTAPGVIGLTQAGVMMGGLVGAVIAPRLQGRLPLWQLALALAAAGAVLLGVASVLLPSPLVALPVAIDLLLAPTANAALIAAMLRATPEGMRGRANSTVAVAATGLAALAPLTSGLLVEHVSGHWAMAAFAAAIGVAAIMCVALPGLRNAG
ncbi:MAG TPA: MFS transporter [Streptosporangiaceae bacterium]|jgi:MFS family permease